MANCIQYDFTGGEGLSDTISLTLDQLTSGMFAWTQNASTDGASIASAMAGMGFTVAVTWPGSTDGGFSDETGGFYVEFTSPANYDWPLITVNNSTNPGNNHSLNLSQAGTIPFTALYWLHISTSWETQSGWWRDAAHTIQASGWPGSVTSLTWTVYVSDAASADVPTGPVAAVSCALFDASAVTVTNPYNIGPNVSIAVNGTLVCGPSGGTSVCIWSGGIGTGCAVDIYGSGVACCNYNASAGSQTWGSGLTLHDSSRLAAAAGASDGGANGITVNGDVTCAGTATVVINALSASGSGNSLLINGTINYNSTASTYFGESNSVGGTLDLSGATVNNSTPLTIGDGFIAVNATSLCTIKPTATTATVEVNNVGGTANIKIDTSNIPSASVREIGVDGGTS